MARATPGIYGKDARRVRQGNHVFRARLCLSHVNVDGLPLDVTGFNERNVSADMLMYDRVEVVRGATGLMEGAGRAVGSINMIRKRPTATPLLNASVTWAAGRTAIDGGRQQCAECVGARAGQGGGQLARQRQFVDVVNNKNSTVYAIVEAD